VSIDATVKQGDLPEAEYGLGVTGQE